MAAIPSSPKYLIIIKLKTSVVTPVDKLVTISDDPLDALFRITLISQVGF